MFHDRSSVYKATTSLQRVISMKATLIFRADSISLHLDSLITDKNTIIHLSLSDIYWYIMWVCTYVHPLEWTLFLPKVTKIFPQNSPKYFHKFQGSA